MGTFAIKKLENKEWVVILQRKSTTVLSLEDMFLQKLLPSSVHYSCSYKSFEWGVVNTRINIKIVDINSYNRMKRELVKITITKEDYNKK